MINSKVLILVALGATVAAPGIMPIAQADMRWKTEMKMEGAGGGKGAGAPMMSFTTAVKAGAQRKETAMNMGPFSMNDVLITLCEKKQKIRLDDKLKIYTVLPIDADESPMGAISGLAGALGGAVPGRPPKAEPATGKIISTVTVQDLGEETIADVKTRHWMINTKMESSGCAGNGVNTMKMEVWVADLDEPVVCPDTTAYDPARQHQSGARPDCKITFETRGEGMEIYSKIFRGIIMRQKMYDDKGKAIMTQEVTMLTRAKQEDSLFAVPADYKQVTSQQFDQQRSQAMMKAMMGGAGLPGGVPGGAGDDN